MQWLKNRYHGLAVFLRFLTDRSIERRYGLMWGYIKLRLRGKFNRHDGPLKVAGMTIHYGGAHYLHSIFKEIFIDRIYAFQTKKDAPLIIDAGANIGIATLFYKYAYPNSKIIAFEPDPRNFELLEKNVKENGLSDVELHNLALADREGTISFYYLKSSPGGDIGYTASRELRESAHDKADIAEEKVRCVPLKDYLKRPVDVLKIDIEGSEGPAMKDAARVLGNVGLIMMEFHYERASNPLHQMLGLFEAAGHDWTIEPIGTLQSQENSLALIYTRKRASEKKAAA